jgi:hypothetical protein
MLVYGHLETANCPWQKVYFLVRCFLDLTAGLELVQAAIPQYAIRADVEWLYLLVSWKYKGRSAERRAAG